MSTTATTPHSPVPTAPPSSQLPPVSTTQSSKIPKEEALSFLHSLLNKNLRVHTTDGRMFWGEFKCVDYESNLILQHTYEYRPPTQTQLSKAAAAAGIAESLGESNNTDNKLKFDMTSRYLGLVVVPGRFIVKIEKEEFASQLRGRERRGLGMGGLGQIV